MKKALLISAFLIVTPALADSSGTWDVSVDPSLGTITHQGNTTTWSYTGTLTPPVQFGPSCYPTCGTADELRFGVYFTSPLDFPGGNYATLTITPVTPLPPGDGWYGASSLTVNGTLNVVPWGIPPLTASGSFSNRDIINFITANYVYYANPQVNLPVWLGSYTLTVQRINGNGNGNGNGIGNGNGNHLLDSINFVQSDAILQAGVPEPSTWAMMLIGFVGLGFAFRRSRRKVSFAKIKTLEAV